MWHRCGAQWAEDSAVDHRDGGGRDHRRPPSWPSAKDRSSRAADGDEDKKPPTEPIMKARRQTRPGSDLPARSTTGRTGATTKQGPRGRKKKVSHDRKACVGGRHSGRAQAHALSLACARIYWDRLAGARRRRRPAAPQPPHPGPGPCPPGTARAPGTSGGRPPSGDQWLAEDQAITSATTVWGRRGSAVRAAVGKQRSGERRGFEDGDVVLAGRFADLAGDDVGALGHDDGRPARSGSYRGPRRSGSGW